MIAIAASKTDSKRSDGDGGKWFRLSLMVVATLLLVNITLLLGKYSGPWDAANFFCPFQMLLADYARHGEFLLWTPLINAGYPAGIDPQVGAFSPITVVLGLLTGGCEFGFRAYWLIIWAMGGTGIVVLARHLSAPRWAAYMAAVGFMFSGIYIGHAEHTCFLAAISFLPWILWRLDAAIVKKSLSAAAQAGALFGLSALAGYPGMVIISGCFACSWLAGGIWLRAESAAVDKVLPGRGLCATAFDKLRRTIVAAAVFLAVAAVVMSPTYLGFMVEARDYSDRAEALPRDVAVKINALHPASMATFAGPFLAIAPISNEEDLYPGTDISTSTIYVFPLIVVLAAAALWQKPRDAFRWCLAVVGLLCLLCAMGSALPLRGWLYDWFAPMRYFRHSGIFRCYYMFALVILALLGGRDMKEVFFREGRIWKKLAILCCSAAIVATGVFIWIFARHASRMSAHYLIFGVAHLALVWLGTSAAVLIGWRSGNHRLREGILKRYVAGLVVADAVLSVVICKPMIYLNRSAAWSEVEAKHVASIDLLETGLERELHSAYGCRNNNLPEKKAVFCGYSPLKNRFQNETADNPLLVDIALGSERIWFARQAAEMSLTEESFRQYARDAEINGRPCLVVSSPPGAPCKGSTSNSVRIDQATEGALEDLSRLEPIGVRLLKYRPRELAFEVICPDKGWILTTERWAAGWSAAVNGQTQPIAIGNFIFRALAVEKGLNRIDFRYCPFGYPWLLMASWATLGIIFSVPAAAAVRTKFSARRGDKPSSIIPEEEFIETLKHKRKGVCTMDPIKARRGAGLRARGGKRERREMLISAALPVYNEVHALPALAQRLKASLESCGAKWEIIFINDGSSDGSGEELDRLASEDERVRVVHLSRNFGHQAALQAGLACCRGDAVVLMDSDMQDSPESIPRFVEAWRAGYDVVYAVRVQRKESLIKRFLFAAFHRAISWISPIGIPADAGNFGLIDRRVVGQIMRMGERDRYFPGLRCWVGFAQTGIEVERIARYDGRPRVSFMGLCRLAKTAIYSFSTFPLFVFQAVGIAASLIFAGVSCFALYCKFFTDLAIPGWTSYMLLGSFFGAINLLGICTLGEYVIRIYDQVRARPLYIVDRTVNLNEETASFLNQSEVAAAAKGVLLDDRGRAA